MNSHSTIFRHPCRGTILHAAGVLALLCALCAAPPSGATPPVVFNFSGVLNYKRDNSNLLPADITETSPFSGTVSYQQLADSRPEDVSYGYYVYGLAGGLNMSAIVAGHTITSFTPTDVPFDVIVIHDRTPGTSYDQLHFETTNLRFDGAPYPGVIDTSVYVDFLEMSGNALHTDALPTVPPLLADFPVRHFGYYGSTSDGADFLIQGDITNISAVLQPQLLINRTATNSVLLSWTAGTYQLDQSPTATGAWSQVPLPYETNAGGTLFRAVPLSESNGFFRLSKF